MTPDLHRISRWLGGAERVVPMADLKALVVAYAEVCREVERLRAEATTLAEALVVLGGER